MRRVASVGKSSPKSHWVFTFLGMLFPKLSSLLCWRRFGDTLDVQRAPRAVVDVYQRALEEDTFPGNFEALRLISQKSFHHRFDLPTEHTFMRPGETGVAKKSGATGKNLLVSRL